MIKRQSNFTYEVYESANELNEFDRLLLQKARSVAESAYAPYSNFMVGAAAKLANGMFICGTNQENASFPAGICAERVLFSSASSQFPGVAIESVAISYQNINGESKQPISPCGLCRQTFFEYEERQKSPIRLILGGMKGEVCIIPQASLLLPLSFGKSDIMPL